MCWGWAAIMTASPPTGSCPARRAWGDCGMRSMMPDSAGSQFFIMHADSPHLDGSYAAFGKVVEGMDVVDRIAEVRVDYNDRPLKTQKMKSVTVDTFGESYEEPEKV